MPNYIRSQSPWLAAADAMNGVANPLLAGYLQQQQIRAQMQQHADQMGIAQGHLQLQQQDQNLHAPLYQAETSAHNAQAAHFNAQAQEIARLLDYAANAYKGETNPVLQGITAAATLKNPTGLRDDMTKPYIVPQNATMMNNQGVPLGTGMRSVPLQNNAYTPQQFTNNIPPSLYQQGQFRPTQQGRSPIDQLLIEVARGMSQGTLDPKQDQPTIQSIMGLTNSMTKAQSPQAVAPSYQQPATSRVRVKGPNGETGTIQQGDTLPPGWTTE